MVNQYYDGAFWKVNSPTEKARINYPCLEQCSHCDKCHNDSTTTSSMAAKEQQLQKDIKKIL